MIQDWRNSGFAIYLHWPYCEAKCPYCDFNSYVARSIDHAAWRKAYLAELKRYAAETPGRVVNSVFFGGGTPSLMEPETVSVILDEISRLWPLANDIEITLEANPSSVEASKFAAFRAAGINRVSLGVQALNDPDLKRLGRLHTVAEAYTALDIAQNTFERASFDLIYARQDQTLSAWEAELNMALTKGFSHFSLYQLTIEDGTAFGDRYKIGRLKGLPKNDLAADMYEMTHALCGSAGLPYYEVSNFSAPSEESRHNLIYWTYGDYLGIGPGAHGRLTSSEGQKYATETYTNPQRWLMAALSGGGETVREVLDRGQQADELLLMNMRLRDGMDMKRYEALAGRKLPAERLKGLIEDGAVVIENGHLRITQSYVPVTNMILEQLASD